MTKKASKIIFVITLCPSVLVSPPVPELAHDGDVGMGNQSGDSLGQNFFLKNKIKRKIRIKIKEFGGAEWR